MENYAEIFGNIMRKKVAIMRKKSQIMRKFPKLMKLFPLFFQRIKYMLTSYRAFQSSMTCLNFCCHLWAGISSFSIVCAKLSNQAF